MKRVNFTEEEDNFLLDNIHKCRTLYDLTDLFNERFERHHTNARNISKRLSKLGAKKGTHNIRKDKIKSKNKIGTVITNKDGKKARVKTENGYVHANTYFKNKYFPESRKDEMLIHLNGDYADFSRNNIVLVSKSIYASLMWRGWVFANPELTKTAILTAQLLEFFPDLRHNENQYYKCNKEAILYD